MFSVLVLTKYLSDSGLSKITMKMASVADTALNHHSLTLKNGIGNRLTLCLGSFEHPAATQSDGMMHTNSRYPVMQLYRPVAIAGACAGFFTVRVDDVGPVAGYTGSRHMIIKGGGGFAGVGGSAPALITGGGLVA